MNIYIYIQWDYILVIYILEEIKKSLVIYVNIVNFILNSTT